MAKAGKKPQKPEHRLRQKTPSTTKPEKKQKDKKEKIEASEASRGRSKEKAPCTAVVPRTPQNKVRGHGSPTSSQVRNIAELMETKKVPPAKASAWTPT